MVEENKNQNLESLIFRANRELREDKSERQARKEFVRNVLSRLIDYSLSNDSRYTQQLGIVSRAYRGLGYYGKEDGGQFDVQVPMQPPDGAEIQYIDANLPFVDLTYKKGKGVSGPWASIMEGSNISSHRAKKDLHEKLSNGAQRFKREQGTYVDIRIRPLKLGNPIEIDIEPKDKWPINVNVVPALFGRGIPGLEGVKESIKTVDDQSKWPADSRSRGQVADQVRYGMIHILRQILKHHLSKFSSKKELLLLPHGDSKMWQLTLLLGHKMMVTSIQKDGTARDIIYRTMKILGKKYWIQPQDDQEITRLVLNSIQQVYFSEISRYPNSEQWSRENLVTRFKNLLQEIRNKISQGEIPEYMLPGNRNNVLRQYKQGAYLIPKVGGVVKRIETTVKDAEKVFNDLFKANQAGSTKSR